MQNWILITGEVQKSIAYDNRTVVTLQVKSTADTALYYLGPQLIDVQIPDTVMRPNEIKPGTFLRVQGMLESERRVWSLEDFIARAAPDLESLIDWTFDPRNVKCNFTYSHIRAFKVRRRPFDEEFNTAFIEGIVVSRPRAQRNARIHFRISNFPDEPVGMYANGKQQAVYGSINVDRSIMLGMNKHIRTGEGILHTFTEYESLAYFVNRAKVPIVWPDGFDPLQAIIPMTNLAIATNKVYEIEHNRSAGEASVLPGE